MKTLSLHLKFLSLLLIILFFPSLFSFFTFASTSPPIEKVSFYGFQREVNGRLLFDEEAQKGLDSILKGEEFNYGLPLFLFKQGAREQALTPKKSWRIYGFFPSPPSRKTVMGVEMKQISLGQSVFKRRGQWVVNANCFSCHAGVVAGQVVAGLSNAHVDATSYKETSRRLILRTDSWWERTGLRLLLGNVNFQLLKGYKDHLKTILLPSIQAQARGENHGPWVVWRLISRMKNPSVGVELIKTSEESPLEKLLDRPLPPVDAQPWWNLKYKSRAFWTRDVSPHSYATFALNLMDASPLSYHVDDESDLSNTQTFDERMERTRLQLSFARQTQPPPYPRRSEVNPLLAQKGHQLFHGQILRCFECHGNYNEQGNLTHFPDRGIIPIEVIGTDPAYASILHNELLPLYKHFQKSPFAPTGVNAVHYPEVIGYAPPPLKGIWASAPYFHNGSVPNVYGVLNSKARPDYWQRSLDPWSYDHQKLGLVNKEISPSTYLMMKEKAEESRNLLSPVSLDLRTVFSTQEYGRSHSGHPFGDQMNDEERWAVIEFLKLL